MPSEKTILTSFAHGDLQAAVSRLQVTVTDRRRKDALIAGLLKDRATPFATLLGGFAAPALKLACEALDLTPDGRGKAAYVAALAAAAPQKKSKAKAAAKAPAKAAPAPRQAAKPKAGKAAPAAKAGPKKTAVVPAANKKAHDIAQKAPTPAAKARVQVVKAAKAVKAVEAAKAAPIQSKSAAPVAKAAPALVAEVLKQDGAMPASEPAEAKPAEPAKKAPARRGPLSWSEAAQMAAHRGQSAATMLRAPAPQTTGTVQHTCTKCHESVTLQACQVQACNNYYVAAPGRKICSECLFERNTISMDDFNDRLQEERQCTHCGVPMTHLSGGNA